MSEIDRFEHRHILYLMLHSLFVKIARSLTGIGLQEGGGGGGYDVITECTLFMTYLNTAYIVRFATLEYTEYIFNVTLDSIYMYNNHHV